MIRPMSVPTPIEDGGVQFPIVPGETVTIAGDVWVATDVSYHEGNVVINEGDAAWRGNSVSPDTLKVTLIRVIAR